MAYKYKKRSCPDAIERAQWAKFTPCEVARHGTLEDGWCIIHGRVYDITSFAVTHPGWENAGQVSTALAIVRSLGQDCTEEFAYTHSLTAWKQLADFQIGVVSACAQPRCALCSKLPPTQVEVFAKEDEDEDEEKNVVPSDHPMPSWLPDEVVNFWQRYKQGVTEQLKRYLKSAGYPQDRSAHQHREIMS